MPQNDLLEQVNANGPFTQQLQAPTYEASKQQASGFQGATGNVADIADKFLAGLSKGRADAYNRSMQQKQQTFTAISGQIQQLQQTDLPPEIKAQQLAKLNDLRGHVFLDATGDGGSSKGKKGGGQSSGGSDPNHPGPHILNAVRGMVTSMLGPGKQPGTVDPEELQTTLSQTNQLIGNAPKIQAEHVAGLDKGVTDSLGPLVKAENGQLPTFAKAMSDPNVMQAFSKNMQSNGGKLTPAAQGVWDGMQAREKEQQATNLQTQRDTANADRVDKRDRDTAERMEASKKADQIRQDAKDADQAKRDVAKNQAEAGLKKAETAKNWAEAGVAQEKIKALKTESQADKHAPSSEDDAAAIRSRIAKDPSLGLAAWNYLANDKFDTRGLGKDAHKDIQEIKSAAGYYMQKMDLNPGDVFALRGQIKANVGALSNVTKQAASVEQFEDQLDRNITTLEKLDKANPRYDAPFANRILQAYKTGKGDPEAIAEAAQLTGTAHEWAKLMAGNTSSSGVTVSGAKQTDDILNTALSSGQIGALVKVMRQDAVNKHQSSDREMKLLGDKIRGVVPKEGKPGAPPTQAQGNAAPPQTAAGNPAPPTAAPQPGPPQGNKPSLDDIFKKKK